MIHRVKKEEQNNAYIDGANLHHGIRSQGWILDYRRFRIWLKEKHGVKNAYLFLGLIPKHHALYQSLQEAGFILVFKEVVFDRDGKPKGNCDADLVLQVTVDFFHKAFQKAVIVTSDGDYAGLVKMLHYHQALEMIVSPAQEKKCSILLKRSNAPITYLGQPRMRPLLELQKEKAPDADGTAQGSSSW